MFWNATTFPLCNAIDFLWNRYCVSRGCCVTAVILFPNLFMNSMAKSFHEPPVSIAIGVKWWVLCTWLSCIKLLGLRPPPLSLPCYQRTNWHMCRQIILILLLILILFDLYSKHYAYTPRRLSVVDLTTSIQHWLLRKITTTFINKKIHFRNVFVCGRDSTDDAEFHWNLKALATAKLIYIVLLTEIVQRCFTWNLVKI